LDFSFGSRRFRSRMLLGSSWRHTLVPELQDQSAKRTPPHLRGVFKRLRDLSSGLVFAVRVIFLSPTKYLARVLEIAWLHRGQRLSLRPRERRFLSFGVQTALAPASNLCNLCGRWNSGALTGRRAQANTLAALCDCLDLRFGFGEVVANSPTPFLAPGKYHEAILGSGWAH